MIPAFNEAATIGVVLQKLLPMKEVYEVIVIDDGSRDATAKIVKKHKHKKLTLILHGKNQGKGKAIQTGLKQVKGDYVLIQDADLEYDPADIPQLIEPIKKGRVNVVYGSRFFGPHSNMFFWHLLGNRFLNFVVNLWFDSILSDMETCYKVLPTKVMKELSLKENDFRIEPEITCKLLLRQEKIMEVPISYVSRTFEEGKKITWRDGFKALATITRIRLFGD